MKSFTDGGGKSNHAVVRGVRSRASLVDKSNIGPSRSSSARMQNFSVQSSKNMMSAGKVL